MNRRLARRIACALFAPWFAISVAGPTVGACAMTGAHGPGLHGAASTASAMADMPGMPDMDGPHKGSSSEPPQHPDPMSCCLVGCCCNTEPLTVARAPEIVWESATVAHVLASDDADGIAPAAADHLLPFANGPPAARV